MHQPPFAFRVAASTLLVLLPALAFGADRVPVGPLAPGAGGRAIAQALPRIDAPQRLQPSPGLQPAASWTGAPAAAGRLRQDDRAGVAAPRRGGTWKWIVIGAAGAGAAGAVLALRRGSSPDPTPDPVTITIGPPTVGGPS